MLRTSGVAIVLLGLGLAQAAAQIRDGVYDAFDCTVPVSDQRIAIRGNDLLFYETTCRLGAPAPVEGMEGGALYWADCTGEGETWRERFLLKHHVSGALLVAGSHWFDRHELCEARSPEDEATLGAGQR
ncbi:hypothetical protein [Microbaculum sp. FT89]|uniref:hypothetical protein n=1 Tax=Microbaculum sp. FT89 TaxID=3447298 RepID=UPI003F536593